MNLIWTENILLDIEKIKDYIARDSQYYAQITVQNIIDIIEELPANPRIGREVPEAGHPFIREVFYKNYRIMYQLDDTKIILLTVIHGSRDINYLTPWNISG